MINILDVTHEAEKSAEKVTKTMEWNEKDWNLIILKL